MIYHTFRVDYPEKKLSVVDSLELSLVNTQITIYVHSVDVCML